MKAGHLFAVLFMVLIEGAWAGHADVEESVGQNAAVESEGAQPPPPVTVPAEGYEWLSYMLTAPGWRGGGQHLMERWPGWDERLPESIADRTATSMTVLVLGDSDNLDFDGLEAFVRAGGTLVVATDSQPKIKMANTLSRLTGAMLTGERIRSTIPKSTFQNNPFLIQVEGKRGFPWFTPLPGVTGALVVNGPCRVNLGRDAPAIPVGWYKGEVELMPSGPRMEEAIFAAVCQLKPPEGFGRVALLADPNVLSNQMLTLGGNLAFACNLAEWITTDGLGNFAPARSQLLLAVNGEVVDKPFVPPLAMPEIPMPNFDKDDLFSFLYRLAEGAVQAGEGLIAQVDDSQIPDRAGMAILRLLWPRVILIALAVGVSFWLVVVLSRRTLNQSLSESKSLREPTR